MDPKYRIFGGLDNSHLRREEPKKIEKVEEPKAKETKVVETKAKEGESVIKNFGIEDYGKGTKSKGNGTRIGTSKGMAVNSRLGRSPPKRHTGSNKGAGPVRHKGIERKPFEKQDHEMKTELIPEDGVPVGLKESESEGADPKKFLGEDWRPSYLLDGVYLYKEDYEAALKAKGIEIEEE